MKTLAGLLMLAALVISAEGQDAKVIAEISASSEKIVKSSPFSADAVSESVQTLADGNRIVRCSTSKLYRNGEGRFRREIANGSGGMLGSVYSFGSGVTILDPVIGHRYLLNSNLKTAHQGLLKIGGEAKTGGVLIASKELKDHAVAVENELKVVAPAGVAGRGSTYTISGTGVGGGVVAYSFGGQSKYEERTEKLGMQTIEGVEAEGTRTVTTIPAGAVGNERPIDIVYERWYSNDLQLVVLSRHSDPRSGEQTYRLTSIRRGEPDPSLFTVPNGYRVISEPATLYRLHTTKSEAEKAAAGKAAQKP